MDPATRQLLAHSVGPLVLGAVRGTVPLALSSFAIGLVLALLVALARLSSLRVPAAELEKPLAQQRITSRFELKSPLAGTVVDRAVTPGQSVGGDPPRLLVDQCRGADVARYAGAESRRLFDRAHLAGQQSGPLRVPARRLGRVLSRALGERDLGFLPCTDCVAAVHRLG